MSIQDESPFTVLDESQCWEFLRRHEFGRFAFHLADEVHIVPVNYAVEPGSEEKLLFRTAEGSKLLGVVMNPDVAFEVDEHDDEQATSIILRGRARQLEEDEEHRAENVPLRPWVGSLKYNVVEITPDRVTGRSFRLHRPWTRLRTD